MKNFKFFLGFICLIIASALIGCAPPLSSEKDITSFSFEKKYNESYISDDIKGVIKDSAITVKVPINTAREKLIATFTTTGKTVQVNSVEQKTGVTANDFSKPVVYMVTAQNGSTKEYTVNVSIGEVVQNTKSYNLANELVSMKQTIYKNDKYLLSDKLPVNELYLPEDDILIKSNIDRIAPGPDNIWETNDDILDCNYMMVSDTRTVYYSDIDKTIISAYIDYTINNGKVTKMLYYNSSGLNGVWFDGDDTLIINRIYEYDSEGRIVTLIEYFNNSSVTNRYVKYAYNGDNKIDTIKTYHDSTMNTIFNTLKFNYTDGKVTNIDVFAHYFQDQDPQLIFSRKITYNEKGRIYQLNYYKYTNNNPVLTSVTTKYYNEYGYISSQEGQNYENNLNFNSIYTYEFK